jgi:hypothetical protein
LAFVPLADERILRRTNALTSWSVTGDIYLTNKRIVFDSDLSGAHDRIIDLASVTNAYADSRWWFWQLTIVCNGQKSTFVLYRAIPTIVGWPSLHRQWATAIKEAASSGRGRDP